MDHRYMDTCEFDTLSITPIQQKEGVSGIKVGPDLLRLVSLVGLALFVY